MSLGPLYVFLGEVSVQVLSHFLIGLFVFLEWSRVSSLYIWGIRSLSEVSLATAWMELENIMLSEISQVVKDKYHMISPIRRI